MTERERCKVCNKPRATEEDWRLGACRAECEKCSSTCWGDPVACHSHAVDWRARALKAEAALVALRESGKAGT